MSNGYHTTIISILQTKFWAENYAVATGTFPIAACNFARFAGNDIKGRQVATRNIASCL